MSFGIFLLLVMAQSPSPLDQPIDAGVWEVGPDATRNIFDAVILHDSTHYQIGTVKHYRMVRIFSEQGQGASFLRALDILNLRGRVVQPDGTTTTFSNDDLIESLLLKSRLGEIQQQALLPPGLSKDCVVEMSWEVPASGALSGTVRQEISEAFFCLKKTVRVDSEVRQRQKDLGFSFLADSIIITYKKGSDQIGFQDQEIDGAKLLTYTNIPPALPYPFGNPHLDDSLPYFQIRRPISWAAIGTDEEFWQRVVDKFVTQSYKDEFKGKAYKNLLSQVKPNLPKPPGERLLALAREFDERIRPSSEMTQEQQRVHMKKRKKANSIDKYYRILLESGHANGAEGAQIFYQLAKDCDIPFKLVFPTQSTGEMFVPRLRSYELIDFKTTIFMVKGETTTTVAPQQRHWQLGSVAAPYQGMPCLVVDPYNKWSHSFDRLPIDPPAVNQQVNRYQMKLSVDGTLEMNLKRELTGDFRRKAMDRFNYNDSEDRHQAMKNFWETRIPNWQLGDISMNRPNTPRALEMTLQANRKLEDNGAQLVALDPFPATFSPLELPDLWLENRSQPLILDHTMALNDTVTITLPEGYRLRGTYNWKKSNVFGEVLFMAKQENMEVTVSRRFLLQHHLAGAAREPQLKQLLGWLRQSLYQRVAFVVEGV